MARWGKRGLSDDDKALWTRVAATTTPLERSGAPRIAGAKMTGDSTSPPPRQISTAPRPTSERLPEFRIGEKADFNSSSVNQTRTLSSRMAHAPIKMDHGTHRRMVRGKLKPEATLDLHGMTLAEAHPALVRFIYSAQDADKRLVIVVTGKGKDRDSGGPIPVRRGILRHQVPAWLTAPPLGTVILDIREAHQKHGGGGAFYVYLKRRR